MEALRDTDPTHIGAQTLLARIGAGGMGQVYLGRSPGGRLVAIKVIKDEITGHPEALARFRREAETVRAVRSAYTANLIDASLAAPPYWLATEYVAGPTLADAVRDRGALPADTCRKLFAALAEGLASVHAYGVTHRDLKPQNVILGVQGPQLIDFGIARAAAQTALTQFGTAPGTPGYTAPEVLLRGEVADAADVFALGATIAYAATGRAPFGTGEPTAVNFRAVHGEIDVEGVEPGLAGLVRACVAAEPGARPALAEVIRRCAVDAALVDDPVYATLLAAGAEQERGLPSGVAAGLPVTVGPGLSRGPGGYVPTYVPPRPVAAPVAGASAGRRPSRPVLAAVAGLVVVGLVAGGYVLSRNTEDKAAAQGPRGGGSPSGSAAAPEGGGAGGALPDHIENNSVSRDLWGGTAPGDGGCNLPGEERAEFLVGSVADADVPDAKTATGKVKISIYLKPYHTEKAPYIVSVGVKPPHDIELSTSRPYEHVRDYNKTIGYTSKPVDLADKASGGSVELTYPDDFVMKFDDYQGSPRTFPAIPLANDPGDWTVLVYRVRGIREYSSIYCTGFPVK
ncbi:serine/threonine-protein kinase [Streptomyces sp. Isolate_45]|uniref:serine/threonine-protein kinase n=1 Tax=Streptomyces sp. Isolate_45 TaxID=2950111 RepID=UPI002481A2DA|nr:serine/threonine-protein kinase [Streptomyces sp. Isolate_45]MDA5279143.1 serine/threonine-protein kinase [Streptomyces sp. Isolate_45]